MNPDILVIGGGVVGLALALEARRRHPRQSVVLLEKEPEVGAHASGRNSGVLHAGFYYAADSLKARLTREGNRRITEYAERRGLRINRCGKLVVATSESDLAGLDILFQRARASGVEVAEVTAAEAVELEPRAKTVERALWSPTTASVDPKEVVDALLSDARRAGVDVRLGTPYLGRSGNGVETPSGRIDAGYVINAAGLHADRVARDFGFAESHRILPFKGLYLYASPTAPGFRRHLYPVPDLRNPFLGVHFTLTVDGRAKIGPTAVPAFWREHYSGLENLRLGELADIVRRQVGLFVRNDFRFRALALEELRKQSRRGMVSRAARLANGVRPSDFRAWGRPGIRAQLLNTRTNRLEMDFRVEGDDRSFHVLNAVSPAFTCALPFAALVFDDIDRQRAA